MNLPACPANEVLLHELQIRVIIPPQFHSNSAANPSDGTNPMTTPQLRNNPFSPEMVSMLRHPAGRRHLRIQAPMQPHLHSHEQILPGGFDLFWWRKHLLTSSRVKSLLKTLEIAKDHTRSEKPCSVKSPHMLVDFCAILWNRSAGKMLAVASWTTICEPKEAETHVYLLNT